ncbi:MAG: MFS transporter [Acidisphaera sp.]|nr:MFS transporter [Acidisphaera sp.]
MPPPDLETAASDALLVDAEIDRSPPAPPGRSRAGLVMLAAAIVLVAANLRMAVTGLGPVLPEAAHATGLGPAGTSVLTTLPSLCFGLFAPFSPLLARRLGTERALLAVLWLLAFGAALRGLPTAAALFAGQILATSAIAVVNVLLPGLVKRDFPGQVAGMTGLYSMALCAGAAVAAAAAVPLMDVLGSWSWSLAASAVPAVLAAVLWATQLPRRSHGTRHVAWTVSGLWRDRLAWQVTFFMGLQSALAYIVFGWLAPMLRDRGMSPADAGWVLSISVVAQAVACLVAPWLATRGRDQRASNVFWIVVCLVGLLGCAAAPLWSIWLCAVILGLAQGALIALALMIIVLRAPDPHVAAHLSGMAQGVGYVLASVGPLAAGLLRGWTGDWQLVGLLCLVIGVLAALSGAGAGRAEHVRVISRPGN